MTMAQRLAQDVLRSTNELIDFLSTDQSETDDQETLRQAASTEALRFRDAFVVHMTRGGPVPPDEPHKRTWNAWAQAKGWDDACI